ncbi:hypothetical protein IWX48DRAFT_678708 [Phyllosticta citricarpa]
MATASRLPESHRVLQLESTEQPPQVKTVPTPQPGPGSAFVQVLAAAVISYSGDLYNGKRQYPSQWFPAAPQSGGFPPPDPTQRHWRRASWFSSSDFNDASAKLMHGEWRNSTYAQYCKFPLENCIPLNETRLLGDPSAGGLGYRVEDLMHIFRLLVPYAMAAGRIIAMGRNEVALKQLRELDGRVSTVKITGDMEADAAALRTWGLADAFFDISPPMAAGSTHFRSGIAVLRNGGRISLMGGLPSDVSFAYEDFMVRGLSMKGTWMYTREQIDDFLRLVESGLLSLSKRGGLRVGATFGLEQWREAFEAAKVAQTDETVAILP